MTLKGQKQNHHGHSPRSGMSREYRTWSGIVQRCTNPKQAAYGWYGARGITVCERWLKFENFLADMGEKPNGLELERIDNSKGYEPGNCEWATRRQQMRNTRYTRLVNVDGEMLCVRDAAAKVGVPEQRIYTHVFKHKVSHQEAFDLKRAEMNFRNGLA